MSESLSRSFLPTSYQGFNPEIEASERVIPSYMPRAELTFPAFSVLPDAYGTPMREEPRPDSRPQGAFAALDPLPDQQADIRADTGESAGGGERDERDGDVFGFGSTPFITNTDSDNVFDSIGNIFTDGGDTSDWIDVGYNAARMFGGFAEGGLVDQEPMAFAEGGLVPLAGGGKIAIGPGGGLDDLIPTSINGRRAAALSDGEFVVPADVVSMMGDGSSNAGARRLYDLVRQIREAKTGTNKQAGPLPVGTILKRSLR